MSTTITPLHHMRATVLLVALYLANVVLAQTTAFTYQGSLTEAANPATGTYDMLFTLFNTPTVGTGTQQGATIDNLRVQVAPGSFTVTLDFGAPVFDGTTRYLEIKWKGDNAPDITFGAEEVARVNPLFVTYTREPRFAKRRGAGRERRRFLNWTRL
jgi:hypothetical protein